MSEECMSVLLIVHVKLDNNSRFTLCAEILDLALSFIGVDVYNKLTILRLGYDHQTVQTKQRLQQIDKEAKPLYSAAPGWKESKHGGGTVLFFKIHLSPLIV